MYAYRYSVFHQRYKFYFNTSTQYIYIYDTLHIPFQSYYINYNRYDGCMSYEVGTPKIGDPHNGNMGPYLHNTIHVLINTPKKRK